MDTCRVCGSQKLHTILSGYKAGNNKRYSLKECSVCSFISTVPLPTDAELKECYHQEYWHKNETSIESTVLSLFFTVRLYGILREIKKIAPRNGRILEWGAGDGFLMTALNARGYECSGIDLYNTNQQQKLIINTTIEDANFPHEYFDVITCFHVLEHLKDPVGSIERAMALLKPGGVLIVEVPNNRAVMFTLFGKRWFLLRIPAHINHFNVTSLMRACDRNTTEILKISHFSLRVSLAAVVLTIFPAMSPEYVRRTHNGRYPLIYKLFYLMLQICVFPFVLLSMVIKRGCIIRVYIKKK